MTSQLTGTVALVTGASSVSARPPPAGSPRKAPRSRWWPAAGTASEALAAEIEQAGGTALAVGVDITDRTQAEAALQQSAERFRRLDILVNNPG